MLARFSSFSSQRCGQRLAPAVLSGSSESYVGSSPGGNLQQQPARSTWVLRRKWPPPLLPSKMTNMIVGPLWRQDQEDPVLPEDHWYYEADEDQMTRKLKEGRTKTKFKRPIDILDEFDPNFSPPEPNLRLILIKHVEDLGAAGSIVEVPARRARNELILRREAIYASPFNLEWYAELIAKGSDSDDAPSSPLAAATKKHLATLCLGIELSATQPWTVEPWHVRRALRRAGVYLGSRSTAGAAAGEVESIQLPTQPISGPNVDGLEEKDFVSIVIINGRERAPVRCRIRHIGLPYNVEWDKGEREAIFEDQEKLLASLPIEAKKVQIVTDELI